MRILFNVVGAALFLSGTAMAAAPPRPQAARPNTAQANRATRPAAQPPRQGEAMPMHATTPPPRFVVAPVRTIPARAYFPIPEGTGEVHANVAHMTKVFEGAYKDFNASPEGERVVSSLRLGLAYAKLFEASAPGGPAAQPKLYEKTPRAALAARVSNHLVERTRLLKIVREENYGETREQARLALVKLSDVLIADATELGEAVGSPEGERHAFGPHWTQSLTRLRNRLDDALGAFGRD